MLIRFVSTYIVPTLGQRQFLIKRSTETAFTVIRCNGTQAEKKTTLRMLQQTKKTDYHARGYILLVVPLAAIGLGTWQVQRRQWKLRLIKELEERTTAKPIPLPLDMNELEDLEYQRVIVRGRFDHSKELHIMPRSPIAGTEPDPGGSAADRRFQRAQTKTGANIVTAFNIESDEHPNLRILVNRGWVPRRNLKPEARQSGQIEGPVELIGIVRKTEKRQQFSPNNNPAKNHWFYRDIDAMAAALGTAPIFIDADKKSTVPGGPFGGQTVVSLRNEHLSYIITWYSLAAVTFFMWYRAYWRLK